MQTMTISRPTIQSCAIAFAIAMTQISIANADLSLRGYNAQQHDRFENDAAFIGNPYDWSGVSSDGRWATMITPKHFLSARHFRPANGSEMTFFHTNDPTGASETHTVLSGQVIAGSDLYLGELENAVSADVAVYSILHPNHALGSEIMVMGLADTSDKEINQRMGRNIIDRIEFDAEIGTLGTGHTMFYDYDELGSPTGLGNDEARLASQDSGGPSFAIFEDAPALVGIHWFIYDEDTENEIGDSPLGSGDTFVPGYIDEINEALAGTGYTANLTAAPEPTGILLTSLLAIPLVNCRRRRRK